MMSMIFCQATRSCHLQYFLGVLVLLVTPAALGLFTLSSDVARPSSRVSPPEIEVEVEVEEGASAVAVFNKHKHKHKHKLPRTHMPLRIRTHDTPVRIAAA